jgi:hypothetical protein
MPIAKAATRRDVLRLTAFGGVVFASNLLRATAGCSNRSSGAVMTVGAKPGVPRWLAVGA